MLERNPMRPPIMSPTKEAIVMTPKPPASTKSNKITCPKGVQKVAVSTVVSPVTVVAEIEVKNAGIIDSLNEPLCAHGNSNNAQPTVMIAANAKGRTRAGAKTAAATDRRYWVFDTTFTLPLESANFQKGPPVCLKNQAWAETYADLLDGKSVVSVWFPKVSLMELVRMNPCPARDSVNKSCLFSPMGHQICIKLKSGYQLLKS